MLAVRLDSPGAHRLSRLPPPHPPLGTAVVESEVMGICGTDLAVIGGTVAAATPLTLGHEMVGRIATGSGGLPPGTRVLVDPAVSCHACRQCDRGLPHLCEEGGLMGRDADGVFAERASVPEDRLLVVPEEISMLSAGLLQVLGTCVHALRRVAVEPGQVAVVIGLGVAGQLLARLLAQRGARVVGLTRSEEKLALAARRGAITARPEAAHETVAAATGGAGAELVVEAAGSEATLGLAVELAAPSGTVVGFGTISKGGKGLPYYQMYRKELTLWHPRAALTADYAEGIDLVARGELDVDDLVTEVFPLDRFDQALAHSRHPSTLKVLLRGPAG